MADSEVLQAPPSRLLDTPTVELPFGGFVDLAENEYYRIANYDRMAPFLMSIVSSGDLWMYLSSTGGLTAGRVSPKFSIFPYETVDKLHDCQSFTGPLTEIRFSEFGMPPEIWLPFHDGPTDRTPNQRNLYKHVVGDEILFEETRGEREVTFRYGWRMSEEFGFVRTATLENQGEAPISIALLDGLQNLLPWGIELSTLQRASCLVDAYKHNECELDSLLGIYSLTATILDRPDVSEILKATTVWCTEFDEFEVLLSKDQFDLFRHGECPQSERIANGRRSNYFISTAMVLEAGESKTWRVVADVGQDLGKISRLRALLTLEDNPSTVLERSMKGDREKLIRNVASSDGLQHTGKRLATARHFTNTLFNNMRGGVFVSNYEVESRDFKLFVSKRNQKVYVKEERFLEALSEKIVYEELVAKVRFHSNRDLLRICFEYLPLIFSRRHGDPSRPWNQFSIRTANGDGTKAYHYEGNWRDIFQNWEALCQSFPGFLPNIIAKFVNASTADGFNPYRLSEEGFDWEVPDTSDPWNNIGYWGDHQIVYLSRLIESAQQYLPGAMESWLEEPLFCYANVPYRLMPYQSLVADCRRTIEFDRQLDTIIKEQKEKHGSDACLMTDADGEVCYVNLLEKLLVPALAKMSNLVVDGGIWMNTQRPEWNDANNALVGRGLSVVTACYVRRYLRLLTNLVSGRDGQEFEVTAEVEQWFQKTHDVLHQFQTVLNEPTVEDGDRRALLDGLGTAFSDYRSIVYRKGFGGKHQLPYSDVHDFCQVCIRYLDHTIGANRRDDGLFHSYNLLTLINAKQTAEVSPLYVMLEGQVAALSSEMLSSCDALVLIEEMFASPLYRPDQHTFMLYPERKLKGFLARGVIPTKRAESVELLRELVAEGDRSIVRKSAEGEYYFASEIRNTNVLSDRLSHLAGLPLWKHMVQSDKEIVMEIFEDVFQHRTFTGRSAVMYGYEGLGCVYWHMVGKLLLAVQETVFRAVEREEDQETIQALIDAYYRVRAGLSEDKTPAEYGAFPIDPYSHTPKHAGAQQPGMTGQVKEEILTRRGEFGVRVRDGVLRFESSLLRRSEFVTVPTRFWYYDVSGNERWIELESVSLALTVCQVPVVYHLTDRSPGTTVQWSDGRKCPYDSDSSREVCREVFARTGKVTRIDVTIHGSMIAID